MRSKLKHNFTIFILFYKSCVASHFFTTPKSFHVIFTVGGCGWWLGAAGSGCGVREAKHHLIMPSLLQQRLGGRGGLSSRELEQRALTARSLWISKKAESEHSELCRVLLHHRATWGSCSRIPKSRSRQGLDHLHLLSYSPLTAAKLQVSDTVAHTWLQECLNPLLVGKTSQVNFKAIYSAPSVPVNMDQWHAVSLSGTSPCHFEQIHVVFNQDWRHRVI